MTRSSKRSRRIAERRDSSPLDGVRSTQLTIVVALLSAAFLWPSEGAINGDGLHLSFLWLVALAGMQLWRGRVEPATFAVPVKDRLAQCGLAIFFLGTWLSTAYVFHVHGDRRAALNLAFEWTGIIACVWMCGWLARDESCRRTLIQLIAGLGIGLAVYGIWQSQTFYAGRSDEYLEQRNVLDDPSARPSEVARVRQQFARDNIPLDGPERQLWEQRLLSSSEPFGPFALANTLAGVLTAALVLLAAGLLTNVTAERRVPWRIVIGLVSVTVVAWCLVLTKSRTGWVGAAAGLVVLLIFGRRGAADDQSLGDATDQSRQPGWLRKTAGVLLLIGVPAILLALGGLLTGTIDKEVLLESPRSLQFRLLYWMGTSGVINDTPIFGTGPGNFRQWYLAHKLPESSESILDPHNILLDAWCFAGLLGLAGVLLITAGILRGVWVAQGPQLKQKPARGVGFGLVLCLFLHFAWQWINGATLDATHAMLLVVLVCAAVWTWMHRPGNLPVQPIASAAAAVALLVHLLGAGGLQISVLGYLLVTLAVLSCPLGRAERTSSALDPGIHSKGRWRLLMTAAGIAVLAAGLLFEGFLPVMKSGHAVRLGQLRQSSGDVRGALRAFEEAAAADPIAPTPRQRIATVLTYQLAERVQRTPDDPSLKSLASDALAACEAWLATDQRQIGALLTRSSIHDLTSHDHQAEHAMAASIRDLEDVVSRFPSSARFRVRLAIRQEDAGDIEAAKKSAVAAAAIEAINRDWGHSDQYLSAEELASIDRLLQDTSQ